MDELDTATRIEFVLQLLAEAESLENDVKEKKNEISSHLEPLKKEVGTSFTYEGKKYQIRTRGGKHYICEMKPKST